MLDNVDIVIVATKARKCLLEEHLGKVVYKISYTPDLLLRKDFKPAIAGLVENHLGAYRCFRGHQLAVQLCQKDIVLVFEDDAIPINPNWVEEVQKAIPLLDDYEVVSFHGRQHNLASYTDIGNGYVAPINSNTWIVAALSYMMHKSSFDKFLAYKYTGVPLDLVLYRNFNYCLKRDTLFRHDRSEGSLLDV